MKTQHLTTPQQAQAWCKEARKQGKTLGFVATMGALHEGHLSLIRAAHKACDQVVVSIFVNPLQFNNPEDLDKYPRDLATDIELLQANQVAMVFTGEADDFYADVESLYDLEPQDPGIYAEGMEGAHRPGHFAGVREIVQRLFSFVGPCMAFFGEKDFQQVQIIKQLAAEMDGIKVIACPTSRETSGLARSSRNARLSKAGLQQAAIVYQALSAARSAWQKHERLAPALRQEMLQVLNAQEADWEYAEVIDPDNWSTVTPDAALEQACALIAVNIEGVRLIDNLLLSEAIDDIEN